MKVFCDKNKTEQMNETLKKGMYIRAKGRVTFDTFAKENVFMANSIIQAKKEQKMDNAPKKRVELHAHTVMSNMDAVVPAAALVKTAARWGHPAVAITAVSYTHLRRRRRKLNSSVRIRRLRSA